MNFFFCSNIENILIAAQSGSVTVEMYLWSVRFTGVLKLYTTLQTGSFLSFGIWLFVDVLVNTCLTHTWSLFPGEREKHTQAHCSSQTRDSRYTISALNASMLSLTANSKCAHLWHFGVKVDVSSTSNENTWITDHSGTF